MTAITVSDAGGLTTVISTFTTAPSRQAELVAMLTRQADTLFREQPGFGGCAIHASQDGTTVVNYALWRDERAVQVMLAQPAVREHAAAVRQIATVEPVRYTVSHVVQASSPLP